MSQSSDAPPAPPLQLCDGVHTLRFQNWREFKTDLRQKVEAVQTDFWPDSAKQKRRYLYRGQADAAWSLLSSFDRVMDERNIVGHDIEKHYLNMLREFVTNGLELDLLDEVLSNQLQSFSSSASIEAYFNQHPGLRVKIESFAQHYEVKTRLLDWSTSPYIAAFFSYCEPEKCKTDHVAVWCLDERGAIELLGNKLFQIVGAPGHYNKRKIWQRGCFTANWSNQARFEKIFMRSNGQAHGIKFPVLFRCELPVAAWQEALIDLEMMRINFLSVYPDFVGLAKHSMHHLRVALDAQTIAAT
jgi:FRG domain